MSAADSAKELRHLQPPGNWKTAIVVSNLFCWWCGSWWVDPGMGHCRINVNQ